MSEERTNYLEPSGSVRWERGYRCHGYWRGNVRLGVVGISAQADGGASRGYHFSVDGTDIHGTVLTLRTAKKAVERLSIHSPNNVISHTCDNKKP